MQEEFVSYVLERTRTHSLIVDIIYTFVGLACLGLGSKVEKLETKAVINQWGVFFLIPGLASGLVLIGSFKKLRLTEYAPAIFFLGVAVTVLLCHFEVFSEMNNILRQQLNQAVMCNMAIYSLFIGGSYM